MVKTAIKLLLVFIEYNESNYILLIDAVRNVASEAETIPWSNLIGVMSGRQIYLKRYDLKSKLLKGNDVVDVEQCTYALTLVNKTLYEIDDQATFYDQSDFMEDLGIDKVTKLTSEDVPSTLLEEIQLVKIFSDDCELHHICFSVQCGAQAGGWGTGDGGGHQCPLPGRLAEAENQFEN